MTTNRSTALRLVASVTAGGMVSKPSPGRATPFEENSGDASVSYSKSRPPVLR